MKFRIDRDTLADAVGWTARSLPTRPSVPVLTGLLLETSGDELHLSGFDYDTSTRATLPAEVRDEGKALVSGRLLAEIVRALPAGKPVDVVHDGTKVQVTCGSARFSLQTMPVDEYPQLPDMPSSSGTVKADDFATAVGQASAAASRDEMLPLLTGIRLELEGSTISLMATDRFRASLRDLDWYPEVTDISARALVPARVLADTAKALNAGGDITIAVSSSENGDGLIGFEGTVNGGVRRTTTRLLEGDFPRVRQLFTAQAETVAYVGTQTLVDAVKRVALVAERNTPVRLSFSEGQVLLEAGSGDEAQASESVEATIEGNDISIGFNPNYMLEGLSVMTEPVVHLSFTQHTKPAAMSGVAEVGADPDGAFRYLIMPVRLQN
ncbi:DNA polymerase III subunit beta [Aeromicrobium sp. 179-A 4D2 NHS]|uniref:DNA polymerase III subunit beta n=1 Tax=Aeromicrobium sp. 179-A 4D2 NHS TaxID=3142375 RepID=UPI0039A2A6CC